MDDVQTDLVGGHPLERIAKRLDGPLHIGFQNNLEIPDLAFGDLLVEVFQGHPLAFLRFLGQNHLPALDQGPRFAFIGHHGESVTGLRRGTQAQHFDGSRGAGVFDPVP